MRSDVIVIVTPEDQLSTGIIYRVEDLPIKQLISQAAVETFDESILLRFAGIDVMPIYVVITSPFQDRPAGELGSITPSECRRFLGFEHLRSLRLTKQVVIVVPQVSRVVLQ